MKKLFLLSMAAAISVSALAQSGGRSIVLDDAAQYRTPVNTVKPGALPPSPALYSSFSAASWSKGAKKTFTGGQYFSHFNFIDALLGNAMSSGQTALQPIWFDSTVRQRFNTGYGTINYSGAGANIDPLSTVYSSDTDLVNQVYGLGAGNTMKITAADDYYIDSVYITGTYLIADSMRTTNDSLIISVAPTNTYHYILDGTRYPWITNYGLASTDTMFAYAPGEVDSIHKTITSYTLAAKTWVVALDPKTMGSIPDASGSVTLHTFAYAVPGGSLLIPKGHSFAISATFKSTATWIPNVDSVNEFNRFMPLWGYEYPYPTGGYMTYWRKTYPTDRNMGELLFSTDSSRFLPSIAIQGVNLPLAKFFNYEYPDMGAWVRCPSCGAVLGVNDVTSTISGVKAYPNPANDEVSVYYKLTKTSDVTVTLSNTIGQVVSTQHTGNGLSGNASFKTSNLAGGVYFYTLTANGERSTGRVVIAH